MTGISDSPREKRNNHAAAFAMARAHADRLAATIAQNKPAGANAPSKKVDQAMQGRSS